MVRLALYLFFCSPSLLAFLCFTSTSFKSLNCSLSCCSPCAALCHLALISVIFSLSLFSPPPHHCFNMSFSSTPTLLQDGSCNGLQHYAALGRDVIGATSVNLMPCDEPQDVYSGVAQQVSTREFLVFH